MPPYQYFASVKDAVKDLSSLRASQVEGSERDGPGEHVDLAKQHCEEALNELLKADQLRPFAGWASEDIDHLHSLLFKLKSYLDDHRD